MGAGGTGFLAAVSKSIQVGTERNFVKIYIKEKKF
jgi:hypothetical protein